MAGQATRSGRGDHTDCDECDERNDANLDRASKTESSSHAKSSLNVTSVNKESLVYNYSSIILTEAMESLLNRGLNFAILPKKLDITQVLVDFRKFERSVTWKEYFYNQEENCH